MTTLATEQLELDLSPFVTPDYCGTTSLAERYRVWVNANPWVVDIAEYIVERLVASGRTYVSMKAVWEEMRVLYSARFVSTPGAPEFRANNNHTAFLARDLVTRRPEWAARRIIILRQQRDTSLAPDQENA